MSKVAGYYRQTGGVWWTGKIGYYTRAGDKLVYVCPQQTYLGKTPEGYENYFILILAAVADINNYEEVAEVFGLNATIYFEWYREREKFTKRRFDQWDRPLPSLFETARQIFEDFIISTPEEGRNLRQIILEEYENLKRSGELLSIINNTYIPLRNERKGVKRDIAAIMGIHSPPELTSSAFLCAASFYTCAKKIGLRELMEKHDPRDEKEELNIYSGYVMGRVVFEKNLLLGEDREEGMEHYQEIFTSTSSV